MLPFRTQRILQFLVQNRDRWFFEANLVREHKLTNRFMVWFHLRRLERLGLIRVRGTGWYRIVRYIPLWGTI